jgi:hypothetical protein
MSKKISVTRPARSVEPGAQSIFALQMGKNFPV